MNTGMRNYYNVNEFNFKYLQLYHIKNDLELESSMKNKK